MRKSVFRILAFLFVVMPLMCSASNKDERYVVMISLDGCRWDYPLWYDTPFLDSMAEKGVESGLISCFPSKTFPNHYSIATGLHPDHHGIVANSFLDRESNIIFSIGNPKTKSLAKYWGGEPLWLTAKHQGVKTAVFYWPGSDVPIMGEYPDSYLVYDSPDRIPMDDRIDCILQAMRQPKSKRPHLIMGYMEEPDHNGHVYGPQDRRTREVMQHIDSLLCKLYEGMMQLPYADKIDFLVVADHGMAWVTPERKVSVMDKLNPEWIEAIEGNMPANIYVREGCVDKVYNALKDTQHVRVWKKGEVPEEFHYGTHAYCGDVIVSPDLGYVFTDSGVKAGGMHGFDASNNDMHAIFRAVGPDFKNIKIDHFPNIDIYPLVCHLLGIKAAPCDGNIEKVSEMLR